MKLLELLIQENVQWPEGTLWAVQDGDTQLKFTETVNAPNGPVPDTVYSKVWQRKGIQHFASLYLSELASDWATKAVAKAEYDAAVAAKAEREPVAPMQPLVVTTPVLHWYKLLAPVIAAAAEGKVVQYLAADGNWYDGSGAFTYPNTYRIKPEEPKTVKVNGFDVPEPMREAPAEDTRYYLASSHSVNYYEWAVWCGDVCDTRWLSRGVLHSTKEAAVAHAKAMLGIDPYATEDADDEHP